MVIYLLVCTVCATLASLAGIQIGKENCNFTVIIYTYKTLAVFKVDVNCPNKIKMLGPQEQFAMTCQCAAYFHFQTCKQLPAFPPSPSFVLSLRPHGWPGDLTPKYAYGNWYICTEMCPDFVHWAAYAQLCVQTLSNEKRFMIESPLL